MNANLPPWATMLSPGKVEIQADEFYPAILGELIDLDAGVKTNDKKQAPVVFKGMEELDQYWLEVAFQCAKMDVQRAVQGTDDAPAEGGALTIFVNDNAKVAGTWAQKNYAVGRGTKAAAQGKEARAFYKVLRNLMF